MGQSENMSNEPKKKPPEQQLSHSDDSGFSSDEYEMRDIQHDNLDDEAFGFQPMNPKNIQH